MSWIFAALSSYILFGVVNIMDKYVVEKRIGHPYIYIFWLGLFSIWALIFVPFIDFSFPGFRVLSLIFLAALINILASLLYIKAITMEEVSRINIFWQLIPIFTFLWAWIFFGEVLTNTESLAFGVFLLGGVITSFHLSGKKFHFSPAFIWMAGACFLYSFYGIIFDRLTITASPYLLFVYFGLANFILSILFLLVWKKDHNLAWAASGKGLWLIVAVVAIINDVAYLYSMKALSGGVASLVYAVESVQSIFVFFASILLTIFFPGVIKEKINFGNLFLKFFALICVVAGILILSYN